MIDKINYEKIFLELNAGKIAFYLLLASFILGGVSNQYNELFDILLSKFGFLGSLISIVLDLFSIYFNMIMIGLKTITQLISGLFL